MATPTQGRRDQNIAVFGYRERAIAQLICIAAALVGLWHAAAAMTTDVEGGHVIDSLELLVNGESLKPATFVVFGVLSVLALVALYWLLRVKSRLTRRTRGKGLADGRTIRAHLGAAVARERSLEGGRPLRPDLSKSAKDITEFGLFVGHEKYSKEEVIADWGNHVSVISLTGGGKSAMVMVPAAQTAPGALVVTTNEASILDEIATPRRKLGRVWVFDPLERTHWPEPMVWDTVAGCEDAERATARGGAFCMGVRSSTVRSSGNEAFFADTAKTAMESMLHAAALDGRGMSDVLSWALNMGETVATPRDLIVGSDSDFAEPLWARALEGVAQGADDTVASTRTTLQRHIKPLLRRSVLRWVDPHVAQKWATERRAKVEAGGGDASRIVDPVVFDPYDFVRSTDTLVLVSDDNAPSDVSPLCSMLFQEVMDAVKAVAPLSEHQRIEPPMRVVGDEIANVAPIEKLPAMSTEVRKLGVQMVLAFQDDLQVTSRWGDADGMKMLNQMGLELILPGVKSKKTLERFSQLSGTVEVLQRNDNVDASTGMRQSSGLSVQERAALREDEIRRLEDGTALGVYRNVDSFVLKMTPWWERKGGAELSAAAKAEAKARAERGQQAEKERHDAHLRHRQQFQSRTEVTS